ncbi:hypothetical protein K435DRAFT_490304 [Dendrothele bispora CBS 962.96]|uniref:Uncharacterized protein n=1 Tax=Dendrothele bispora (strain CBS 962.96) TaxID=1314807 RepID=A0A4S8KXX4_DENBC|nr:hypothetical protein K435DRAFT_490304 [Dendrothele bispora CBS 962.96]
MCVLSSNAYMHMHTYVFAFLAFFAPVFQPSLFKIWSPESGPYLLFIDSPLLCFVTDPISSFCPRLLSHAYMSLVPLVPTHLFPTSRDTSKERTGRGRYLETRPS